MKVFIAEIKMNTYVAEMIYSITCDGIQTEQYEQQWRLVVAADEAEGLEEARKMAQLEEATFIDRQGRTICWKLAAVKELQPIALEPGALLFSSVKEVTPIVEPLWAEPI